MWLPDEIKKCVAFICIQNEKEEIVPGATGFFVSIPSIKKPERQYTYFVTARHSIAEIGMKKFWVRVNDKQGKTLLLPGDNSVKWFFHPDHAENPADIAIVPFAIQEDKMDIKTIPSSMFLPKEQLDNGDIGIGNEVFITGLFKHLSGEQKNTPIIRMGNIAMIPDEKVPTKKFGGIDAYLIEARSIGGVSGSPVFFCKEQNIKGTISIGNNPIYLAGLIHGHWDTLEEKIDNFLPSDDARESKGINMGIAIVTPVEKILETLNCTQLKDAREENDKKL